MLQKIRWFFLLVAVTIVFLLLLWNSSTVTVRFPFVVERELPLSILLLATSAIGFVFGAIVTGWMLRRRHKQAAKTKAAAEKSAATATSSGAPNPSAGSPVTEAVR